MTVTLVVAFAVAIVACAQPDTAARQEQERAVSEAQERIALSAAQPRVEIPLPAAASGASVLRFTVADVSNPDRAPVGIEVSLKPRADSGPVSIGAVALFPVDQGGTFTLRIPAAVQTSIRNTQSGTARLVLQLTANQNASAPDRRALTVTDMRFSATP